MKILIITPFFPFPLDTGGNNAQYLMIDLLRHAFEITLVCPSANKNNYLHLKENWGNVDINVFQISDENIKYSESLFKLLYSKFKYLYQHPLASFSRLLQHSKNKDILKHKKSFEPLRTDLLYWNFSKMKLEREFVLFVNNLIQIKEFHIIQVEFTSFMSFGFILPKDITKIFIHHEIAFIRTQRELKTLKETDIYDIYIAEATKKYELSCLEQFNVILTFSDVDKNILQERIKIPVYNSPFPVKKHRRISLENFEFRNIVFLGGEILFANREAVEWFISNVFNIMPEQLSNIHFKIVGKWNNETIELHKENAKIEFLGYVEDLQQILNNSVMVVPLKIGSGVRTKILDAFAMGIPVISSTIGIEGIDAKHGVHFLKADNKEEYLKAFNLINQKTSIINDLVNNALTDIVPLYTAERCCKIREQIYQNLGL